MCEPANIAPKQTERNMKALVQPVNKVTTTAMTFAATMAATTPWLPEQYETVATENKQDHQDNMWSSADSSLASNGGTGLRLLNEACSQESTLNDDLLDFTLVRNT